MTSAGPRYSIGGEFELAQWDASNRGALRGLTGGVRGTWTASGRSALGLILSQLAKQVIKHVHLPAYLCESIIAPIRALGFDFSFLK